MIVVPVSTVAKNVIGVFFDALSMNSQVQHICRVAYFHIHCIGKIRNLLDRKTTEIIIHTYVASRLDNENSLLMLYDISEHLLTTLQSTKRCCPAHNQNEETRPPATAVLIDLTGFLSNSGSSTNCYC